jgi:hypothetical protein
MVKFGNSDAFIINDLDLKTKIIDYVFSIIELSKYRYTMLENVQQLNYLKLNEHYVSPNFKGFNYFLLFYKFKDNIQKNKESSYCIAIDKKNLSYHRKSIDLKKIYMYRLKFYASSSIFMGSLFDTKLVKDIMLIKDCYYLMGNNIADMEMNEKLIYLDSIIANQFHKEYCSNFKIKINKLYKYNMLNDIVKNIIPNCELEITGLIFYPIHSGVSYIYTDKVIVEKDKNSSQQNIKIVSNDSYNMIHQIKEFLTSRIYSYENNSNKKVLLLEPTDITDVYYVYDYHISDTNDNQNSKIGVAHIPNLKVSNYCRENITKLTKCICTFSKQFNKWIPLNITK